MRERDVAGVSLHARRLTALPARRAAAPVLFIQQPQPQPSSIIRNVSPASSTARSAAAHSAMSACQLAGIGTGSTVPAFAASASGAKTGSILTPRKFVT